MSLKRINVSLDNLQLAWDQYKQTLSILQKKITKRTLETIKKTLIQWSLTRNKFYFFLYLLILYTHPLSCSATKLSPPESKKPFTIVILPDTQKYKSVPYFEVQSTLTCNS